MKNCKWLCGLFVLALVATAQAVPFDVTNPGDPVTPTSANSPGAEQSPNAIDNRYDTKYLNFDKLNTGFTVTAADSSGVVRHLTLTSANDAPERDPASFILSGSNDGSNFTQIATGTVPTFNNRFQQQEFSFSNSQSYAYYELIFPTVANAGAANSMQIGEVQFLTHQDVTRPSDAIIPSSTNTPSGEQWRNAIDNRHDTKYLNFDKLNTGFTVTPSKGLTALKGLSFTSANDAPERDPIDYVVEGSNDGSTFTQIASGSVPAFANRHEQHEISFANSDAYFQYRLTFPNVQNAGSANSMQIEEVQFFGDIVTPANVVNMDISSAFNADVIVNDGNGTDTTQDGIDGGNRNYGTQSWATAQAGANGNGLPNDGLFTGTPLGFDVQLAYNNNDDGNNAIRLASGESASVSLSGADQGQYLSAVLLATSGDGDSSLTVDLNYGDGSTDTRNVTVDDWFNDGGELGQLGAQQLIDGLDRSLPGSQSLEDNTDPAIFAIQLEPDYNKTLESVDFLNNGAGITSIFGITGTQLAQAVPEPASIALWMMLGAAGVFFALRVAWIRRRSA